MKTLQKEHDRFKHIYDVVLTVSEMLKRTTISPFTVTYQNTLTISPVRYWLGLIFMLSANFGTSFLLFRSVTSSDISKNPYTVLGFGRAFAFFGYLFGTTVHTYAMSHKLLLILSGVQEWDEVIPLKKATRWRFAKFALTQFFCALIGTGITVASVLNSDFRSISPYFSVAT